MKPQAAQELSAPEDVASNVGGTTILIIDDETVLRAAAAAILARRGYQVLEAEHGADAIRAADSHDGPIDLVITDLYMPGLRGPEIVEELRRRRPELHILVMSGYTDDDLARWGVDPHRSFLRKPFSRQALLDSVAKALEDRT